MSKIVGPCGEKTFFGHKNKKRTKMILNAVFCLHFLVLSPLAGSASLTLALAKGGCEK